MKKYSDDLLDGIGCIIWIIFIVVFLLFVASCNFPTKRTSHEDLIGKKRMEYFIGKIIVIGRDTLVIVDYHYTRNSYTLSNGLVVDRSLVDDKYKQ